MILYAIKSYLRRLKNSGKDRNRSVFELRHDHDSLLQKFKNAQHVTMRDEQGPTGAYRVFEPKELNYDTVIIHFHGGTLCMGSVESHTPFVSHLASYTQSLVYLPTYRLAPEHAYPASFDDAVTFYRYVTEELNIPAEKVIISADSGGGLLTFSLIHRCHQLLIKPPKLLLLFAPAATAELIDQDDLYADLDERDPLLDVQQIRRFTKAIFGDHPLDDPMVSPLYADYTAFPPFFSVIGTDELLLDAIRFVHTQAVKAGVDCRLLVQPHCFHGHFMFPGILKEADIALKAASDFMHSRIKPKKSVHQSSATLETVEV